MAIHYLIYMSQQSFPVSEMDLKSILEKANSYNRGIEVTGLLLFRDGVFVQLLEGSSENVNLVMDKIRVDPRHKNIEVMLEAPGESRLFPDWYMGSLDPEATADFSPKKILKEVRVEDGVVPRVSVVKALESLLGKSLQ